MGGMVTMSKSSVRERRPATAVRASVAVKPAPPSGVIARVRAERGPVAFVVASVCALYSVVLVSTYGFYDDYLGLYQGATAPWENLLGSIRGGRPLYGLLVAPSYAIADSVGDLRWIRALAVAATCLAASVLYVVLREARLSPRGAGSLAVILVSLPSFQVYVAWGICWPIPLAVAAAVLAGRACSRADTAAKTVRALAAGVALQLVAVLLYQPAAMAFWLPLAVLLCLQPRERLRLRPLVVSALAFGAALSLGALTLKVAGAVAGGANSRAALVDDPLAKAQWFVTTALLDSAEPFTLNPRVGVVAVLAPVVLIGLWRHLVGTVMDRSIRIAAVGALVPLTYLPNLLIADNWSSFRTQVALSMLVVIVMAGAVMGLARSLSSGARKRAATLAPAAAMVAALIAVQHLVVLFVMPNTVERELVGRQLAAVPDGATIYTLQSQWYNTSAPTVYYDEFGAPSTSHPWMPVPYLSILLRDQLGGSVIRPIETITRDQLEQLEPGSHVVDLETLLADPVK